MVQTQEDQEDEPIWLEPASDVWPTKCYDFTGYSYCIERYVVRTKDDAIWVDVKVEQWYEPKEAKWVKHAYIVNITRPDT